MNSPSTPLSIEQQLEAAMAFHRAGDLQQAVAAYRSVLAQVPDEALALHHLALARHQLGVPGEATAIMQQALALAPQRADWWCDLGKLYGAQLALDEAAAAFQRSLEFDAQNAEVWNHLGVVLEALQQDANARLCFESALQIEPSFAEALRNLGNLLMRLGEEHLAAQYLCREFLLQPAATQSPWERGIAFYTLGQIDDAAAVYRDWLQREPDNAVAQHMLAACGGADIPPRAADAYVERRFNDFAPSFETHLARLAYAGPELLAQSLAHLPHDWHASLALDAGCGTGLCGPILRQRADRVIGVDLAERMLDEAAPKQCYAALEKAELTHYLQTTAQRFDLIAAIDTVIYFGDLRTLLQAIAKALNLDGYLCFTVEATDHAQDFSLHPSGRYQHKRSYLELELATAGFHNIDIHAAAIRNEFGHAVQGWVLRAQRC